MWPLFCLEVEIIMGITNVSGFQRRRRELAAKQAKAATQPQTEPVEKPQDETTEKSKRRKKGGEDDAGE